MRRTSVATSLAMLFTTVFVLGIGSGAQADEPRSVRMKFAGTNVATSINLRPNTVTDETHLTGDGSLGAFTFRELHADGASPQPPAGCTGPNFAVVAGAGVFTFEDGSLLVVTVADGSACIDLAAGNAAITVNYQITGGTGRFREASGELTMSGTLMVVLRNASNAPQLLTNTGRIKGTVFGVKHWE
jgi:hypothetical protein